MDEPALVEVRYRQWPVAVGWLLAAVFEAGLLIAIWRAVVDGEWAIEGVGAVGTVFGWGLVLLFTVLLGLAVVVGLRVLVGGSTVARIGAESAWETTGRRESARVDRATAESITYLPGLRATWQRSGKAVDQRSRWTPAGVGYDRLVLLDRSGARLELASTAPHWPEVVNAVETWTARTPALAADDETREFLAMPYPPAHSRLRRWAGPLVTMLVIAVGGLVVLDRIGGLSASTAPGFLVSAALFGAIVWWGFVRPVVAVVQGVAASVVRRDPWAAFAPDEHGQYNWLLDGRTTMLRAPQRRSAAALLWRWPAFLLLGLAPVLVVAGLTRPLW